MFFAEPSPVMIIKNEVTKPKIEATIILFLANNFSLFFKKNHALKLIKITQKKKKNEVT